MSASCLLGSLQVCLAHPATKCFDVDNGDSADCSHSRYTDPKAVTRILHWLETGPCQNFSESHHEVLMSHGLTRCKVE